MKNLGQRNILVMTKDKQLRWLTVQVAKVKQLLGSVSKNNDHGQEVVYKKSGSYIQDVASGGKVELSRERCTFKFDAWVVPFHMVQRGIVSFRDKQRCVEDRED